uniref:Uncharacterized protein n=1 Tax=Ananas comosus var. bracteatus TaxID=296719 RepID=A0A6V7Q2P9_ANACO|nr:unnamed protein product [Ananas comosus var. bracteatus]
MAAVSGFGKLWEVDAASKQCSNDRRFFVPIEVESFEEANPILLGKDLDEHLGLNTLDAQEGFIWRTGFNLVPAYQERGSSPVPRQRPTHGRRQRALERCRPSTESVRCRQLWRLVEGVFSNSNQADRLLHLLYWRTDTDRSFHVSGGEDSRDPRPTPLPGQGKVLSHADPVTDSTPTHAKSLLLGPGTMDAAGSNL